MTELLRSSINDFAKAAMGAEKPASSGESGCVAVTRVPLAALRKSPYQPRLRALGKKDVTELMQSLVAVGQTTPIVVAPCDDGTGTYHVHQGERRWFAALHLGWVEISAIIKEGLDECSARKIALADNLGREDLTAWEQARALEAFCGAAGVAVEEAAVQLGVSRATAFRLKALLQVSDELKQVLKDVNITARAGEMLARIDAKNPRRAATLARKLSAGEILVRALEQELEKGRRGGRRPARRDIEVKASAKGVDMRIHWIRDHASDAQRNRIIEAVRELFSLLEIRHDDVLAAWAKGEAMARGAVSL